MAYNSNKAKKPSRAEIASDKIEAEVINFWSAIGESDLSDYNSQWLERISLSENAGAFINDRDRYTYQGGFNQILIASYTADKSIAKGPLVINRTDMTQLFESASFADTPVVKNGIKSVGSIFNKPYEKTLTQWEGGNGQIWSPSSYKNKSPSQEEIVSLGLEKKEKKHKVFTTFPVWSIEDIYDVLPQSAKNKVNELVELREAIGYDFDPHDNIEKIIDDRLEDIIKRMGIQVTSQGNSAFYNIEYDSITLPDKKQFKNPVAYFAVSCHEISHSTMAINSRALDLNSKSVSRSKEEVLAESSAVILTKSLERDIKGLLKESPFQDMFDEYYENAMTYNNGHGSHFDFLTLVQEISDNKSSNRGVIKSLIVDIVKTVDLITNGEITPEQRLEKKSEHRDLIINSSSGLNLADTSLSP